MTTENGLSKGSGHDFGRSTTKSLVWAITAVFVLSLGARVIYLATNGVIYPPDSTDYIRLAENIRTHRAYSLDVEEPFVPSIRRAPLYPVFLMVFIRKGGFSGSAVAATQAILDAGVAVLVLLLANAALNLRWATATGLAYAVHPGAIYFSTVVLSETLFTALLALGLFLALKGLLRDRLVLTILAGVAFGLATLCRPISLPLPFLLVGVALFVAPGLTRFRLHAAMLIVCAAVVIVPWTIRCTRVSEQFVLVQGFTTTIFYVGTRYDWNQQDQETIWPRLMTEDPYGRLLNAARTPKEVADADRFGLRLGLQNIWANPRAYVMSRARSTPYLFLTSFDMFTGVNKSFGELRRNADMSRLALKLSLLFCFSLVPFLLGFIGLFQSYRNISAAFCATVWIYTLLINMPMWLEYRYWMGAVPFLLVSAAVGTRTVTVRATKFFAGRPKGSAIVSESTVKS